MANHQPRPKVVIMGAAGRDFHNFNVVYRHNPQQEVVAFTAAQISGIAGRHYPASLAGPLYPEGIPIVDKQELEQLCYTHGVEQVVFAYSDLPHSQVMHLASRALAAGASFVFLGPRQTMLEANVPVIAVSAVRTGCGKSQTTRWLAQYLRDRGLTVAVIRHPMPYGDLEQQAVQRFATLADLQAANCTVEEREEYEPHLAMGNVVYAGVDYGRIVDRAAQEADLILWDGGNNDFPFIQPDLHLVLVDPLRAGHETSHHPGEVVLRMADIVIVAKMNAASTAQIQQVEATAKAINPKAKIVRAASPIRLDNLAAIGNPPNLADLKVLVIEDGPTTTHGGMAYGAGYVAATQAHAGHLVDPRPYAAPDIAAVYDQYPHIGAVLPAMGYSPAQLEALRQSINATPADVVVSATPSDLAALIDVNKPMVRAHYEFAEVGSPPLSHYFGGVLRKPGAQGEAPMLSVVALGGNALLKRGEPLTAERQLQNIRQAARALADLTKYSELVITHGNGPQVGLLALQGEAYTAVPPYPLDVLGAESEGMIGYLLELELRNQLPGQESVTLLTQIEVDAADPAFQSPTKFIGPVYSEAEAKHLAADRGYIIAQDGQGFRRVVPSPQPQEILELATIQQLVTSGVLVICAGGGGIPVVRDLQGQWVGVEAVIDKDLAAAQLAIALQADRLLLLTDVDAVYTHWGTAAAQPLRQIIPDQLHRYPFAPGSMGPKVNAACLFVEATGGQAAIGNLDQATAVYSGQAGTQIHAEIGQ